MTLNSKDCINGLTAINRTNTILSVGRSVGRFGILSHKGTGARCALICVLEIEYESDG